jgi:hypothetical protein
MEKQGSGIRVHGFRKGSHGEIFICTDTLQHPVTLTFSADAFAFLGSTLPPSAYELSPDQELEQWQIREMLPPI